uniref:Uncharacterized protein n=1 Tax=Arundo donax TaxID=35708 RepID=A0A0A9B5R4_ARUDO
MRPPARSPRLRGSMAPFTGQSQTPEPVVAISSPPPPPTALRLCVARPGL